MISTLSAEPAPTPISISSVMSVAPDHHPAREMLHPMQQLLALHSPRGFVDDWLERNRSWLGGASAEKRKTGARAIHKEWKVLHNLRQLRPENPAEGCPAHDLPRAPQFATTPALKGSGGF